MKYLDPKADLTFKRVFGEHPLLVKSFLNALLPLDEDGQIESLEYLPTEMVPDLELGKLSIVDVRCRDQKGRQFIVEMQMFWTRSFTKRVLFNAAKAYVNQAGKAGRYELLQPVYSLALLNQNYMKDTDDWYHLYRIVCDAHTNQVIDGLQFVFVELPKFTPHTLTEKKMTALWLRYLTEIDENTKQAPSDLMADPEVKQALEIVEKSAYTEAQLNGYDHFWDEVRSSEMFYSDAREKGREEGLIEGIKKGREEGLKDGIEKGSKNTKKAFLENMMSKGLDAGTIADLTGLSKEEVETLLK